MQAVIIHVLCVFSNVILQLNTWKQRNSGAPRLGPWGSRNPSSHERVSSSSEQRDGEVDDSLGSLSRSSNKISLKTALNEQKACHGLDSFQVYCIGRHWPKEDSAVMISFFTGKVWSGRQKIVQSWFPSSLAKSGTYCNSGSLTKALQVTTHRSSSTSGTSAPMIEFFLLNSRALLLTFRTNCPDVVSFCPEYHHQPLFFTQLS